MSSKIRLFLFSILTVFIFQTNVFADMDKGQAALNENDYKTALKEFLKDAEAGNAVAQYKVGYLYAAGRLGKADYKKALHWYNKSVEQGNLSAYFRLGFMYYEGNKAVKKDPAKTHELWLKAANGGLGIAQSNIATLYYAGIGVEKDLIQAYVWTEISLAYNYPLSFYKDAINNAMTEEQIAYADGLVKEWLDKNADLSPVELDD